MSDHHHHAMVATDNTARQKQIRKVTWVGATVDTLLGIIKLSVGWLVHSPALVADGLHSLSDLLTDIGVVLFSRWSQPAPDDDHPYGHHRYETLGTVVLGTSLVVVASFIAWDNLTALIYDTREPAASVWAILVALIAIASKEWIFRYTLQAAKKLNSKLLTANAWHSRSDAFSSIVVLLGVVATSFGYGWLELIAAMVVAVLIGHMGVKLTWNAIQDLVDRGVDPELAAAIRNSIQTTPGVLDVHLLRSRMMGNHIYVDVHIQVASTISVSEGHYIAEQVSGRIKKSHDQVSDITVHVDYEEDHGEGEDLPKGLPDRRMIEQQLSANNISPQGLQIHYLDNQVVLQLFFDQLPDGPDTIKQDLELMVKEEGWLREYTVYLAVDC